MAAGPAALQGQTALTDTLRSGDLTIVHAPGDLGTARRLLGDVATFPPLPALPDSLPTGIELVLAPDEETFQREAGGSVPEWGAAVAIPRQARVIVPTWASNRTRGSTPQQFRGVLRHEWAHVALTQALDGLRPPRWFDEGYAEWSSSSWDASGAWRLRLAFALRRAPALDSLALRWPRDRGEAEVAYLLSATAVDYLVRASGERGLEALIRNWRAEGDFELALRRTYGVTLGQLEEDWRDDVRTRYGWPLFLSHSLVIWGALGVLLILVARGRSERTRRRLARLRASEPPARPRFWVTQTSGPEASVWTANPGEAPGYIPATPPDVPPDDGASG